MPYRDAMAASPRTLQIVIAWNAALTLGAAGLTLAAIIPRPARFTEISAERIDITDANGTTRMVISNRDRFPDLVIEGKRGRRSDRKVLPAGIVVYDEQGNEAGGYGTVAMSDGHGGRSAGSMLIFDYGASEAIGIVQRHGAAGGQAELLVSDPAAAGTHTGAGAQRIAVGTTDRAASIELADTAGRPRIRLLVDAHDQPSIAILDPGGAVVRRFPEP